MLCPNTSSPFQQRNWIEEEISVWWKWAKHPPHIKGEKDPLTPAEDYDELNKRLFTSRTVNIICFQLFSSSNNIYGVLALGVPLRCYDTWLVTFEVWTMENRLIFIRYLCMYGGCKTFPSTVVLEIRDCPILMAARDGEVLSYNIKWPLNPMLSTAK